MRYFIGTKFLNYSKKTLFNKPIPTIDLISIGIVSEGHTDCNYARPDGKGGCEYPIREYYAISKDFNLKEVWNGNIMLI